MTPLSIFTSLLLLLVGLIYCPSTQGAYIDSMINPHGKIPAEVRQNFEEANAQPEALWALKSAPLEQIFWRLMRDRAEGRLTTTPEDARRIKIAREILLNHPDLEDYVSRNLKHMGEVLVEGFRNEEYKKANRAEYNASRNCYLDYLGFAANLPDDRAFRLIGPFLFSLYHPPIDHGDVMEGSPASMAHAWLIKLARERLHVEIPNDMEGARQWWRANEHRFAAKSLAPQLPAANPPQPPAPSPSLNSPTGTHVSTSPIDLLKRNRLSVGVLVSAVLILFLLKKRHRW